MPASWFRQEYHCEFNEAEGAVFSYQDVMAALSADVKPLFAEEEQAGAEGVVTVDVKPLLLA